MALMILTVGLDSGLHDQLKELLEGQGAAVRSAAGFEDGRRLLKEHRINSLLVDLDSISLEAGLANLDEIRDEHPEVSRFIIIKEPTVDLLLKSINVAGVQYAFSGSDNAEEITSKLRLELGLDVELPIKPGAPVMVVEKDEEIRRTLWSILSNWGFHVDAIANGTEALKLMRTVQYRVILANSNMPYLMGWTLVEFIKRNVKYRHIPILMLTELPETEAEADIKEKDIDGYLCLPVSEPALRRKLAQLLKAK